MSVQSLANTIRNIVQRRIQNESRALRGTIQGNNFYCGNKSYPYIAAVDADTHNGCRVWAQLSPNGKAVVVGD